MTIQHTPNPNCGVHYLERKDKGGGNYYARIVCENMNVGDIVASHTARTPNGFFEMEVKEIISSNKPKGNYGDGYSLFEANLYVDIDGYPPELTPKNF